MGRLGEFIVFFFITVLASHVLKTLILAGFFRHVLNHSPGPCRIIKVNGSEDFALLPDGLVFVSSGLRYKVLTGYDPVIDTWESKLMTFDLNKPSENPVELTLKNFNRTGFNPHGISVYRDASSGTVSLFVVNHRSDAQAIEIFDFERETHSLIHRRSVVDALIWSPNNLHAVGPDSFYVTNDNFFHFDNTLLRVLHTFLLNKWLHCNIVFFDGFKAIEAIGGVHPNGINMDKDERFVFTSALYENGIAVFRRRQDNTLEASQLIKVGSIVDNINVDPVTGDLWVAALPRVLEFSAHSQNLSHLSPSQVLTVQLGEPSTSGEAFPDYKIREVYMNDGQELSGCTTALVYKDRLLMGAVFSNMLYCEMNC